MSNNWLKSQTIIGLLCLLLVVGILPFFAFEAHAAPTYSVTLPGAGVNEKEFVKGDILCPYNYDGITGRIVPCIKNIIVEGTKSFLEVFLTYYEAALLAIFTLAVTFYGVMLTIGSISRPTGETFIFIFKLGAAAFFALQFSEMMDLFFDIPDALIGIVTHYLTLNGGPTISFCSDDSLLRQVFEYGRPGEITVWDRIDCLFISLLGMGGITVGAPVTAGAMGGLIALMGRFFFTGSIGLIMVVVGFLFIFALLIAVMRAVKIYLMAVIMLAVLVAFSPITIPMILFSQTKPFFDKWVNLLGQYLLLPVFLFAFLVMVVAGFDAVFLKGKSSLYFALADQPSQESPHFDFRHWAKYGAVAQQKNPDPYMSARGQYRVVAKNIPGFDAQVIAQQMDICETGTQAEKDSVPLCKKSRAEQLDMFGCAMFPKVAKEVPLGMEIEPPQLKEDSGCQLVGNVEPYYGFERSVNILNWGIDGGKDTDAEDRRSRCGGGIGGALCSVGKGALKVLSLAVGGVVWVGGKVVELHSKIVVPAISSFVGAGCNLNPIAPGAVCDGVDTVLDVAASVGEGIGKIAQVTGRIIMGQLDDMLQSYFDVSALDFDKVAAYKCEKMGRINFTGLPAGNNETALRTVQSYLKMVGNSTCPDKDDIIRNILYIMLGGLALIYLLFTWLKYIPALGSELIGSGHTPSTALPGERAYMRGRKRLWHGLEVMSRKETYRPLIEKVRR